MKTQSELWYENEFLPWKKAMEEVDNERSRLQDKLIQYSSELKYVVSLLLEKREHEAVNVWNELAMEPPLSKIHLDIEKDIIILTDERNNNIELSMGKLLEELQAISNQQ